MVTMTLAAVAFAVAGPTSAQGQVIWSGLGLAFEKPGFADWTQPANQDRITDNVRITRAGAGALFNITQEAGYSGGSGSPVDTEWAFSDLSNPVFGPGLGAAMYGGLTFQAFVPSLNNAVGSNIRGTPGVVHLITDDIYIDILFDGYGSGGAGAGFSYTRGTPEPSSLALLGLGVVGVTTRRRRKG